ncbi:hypothetical protein HaLaN_18329 [Haematococcus lacustris]|uniref:Uncharacterized protein n=1 Tax=Haematococcus lacustris TaxID=44745 RepID=A0A699ZYI4_HAELA|nr:hypothetical protein HaLaN_18329 [Haematococcus lacustris]
MPLPLAAIARSSSPCPTPQTLLLLSAGSALRPLPSPPQLHAGGDRGAAPQLAGSLHPADPAARPDWPPA